MYFKGHPPPKANIKAYLVTWTFIVHTRNLNTAPVPQFWDKWVGSTSVHNVPLLTRGIVWCIYSTGNPDIVIAGEMNIDLLKPTDPKCRSLQAPLKQCMLSHLISELTRINDISSTYIDYIQVIWLEMLGHRAILDVISWVHVFVYNVRKNLNKNWKTSYIW